MTFKMPSANHKIKMSGGSRSRVKQMKRAPQVKVEEKEEPGLINGREPKSLWEWYMALALWEFGWEGFLYQLAVKGGYAIRGGQVLDFLVPTKPAWTPLAVDGGHWHSDVDEEKFKDAQLLKALRNMGYFVTQEVKHATDKNAASKERARRFVAKTFGRI